MKNLSFMLASLLILSFSSCLSNTDGSDDTSPLDSGTPATTSDSTLNIAWRGTQISTGLINACIGPFNVGVTDQTGALLSSHQDIEVELGADSDNVGFYTDAGCSQPKFLVDIPDGTPQVGFYLNDSVVESTALQISSGQVDTVLASNISFSQTTGGTGGNGGGGTTNTLSGPSLVIGNEGSCSGPIVFGVHDVAGNPVAATADVDVIIGSDSNYSSFYTDANCQNSTSDVTIASGTVGINLYFIQNNLGAFTVTGSSTIGNVEVGVSMNPGVPATIVLTSGTGGQNDCIPVNLSFNDQFGNATLANQNITIVATVDSAQAGVFSDPGCSNTTGTSGLVTITSGQSNVTFWVKDSATEELSVEGTDPSDVLNSGDTDIQISCGFFSCI